MSKIRQVPINQKGFTLLELVVVVTILGILLGVTVPSIASVSHGKARRATAFIMDALAECRIMTVSGKKDPSLQLFQDREGSVWLAIYVDGTAVKTLELGKHIALRYRQSGDSSPIAVSEVSDKKLILRFHRDTGAFSPLDSGKYCELIFVGKYAIECTPATGYYRQVNERP